MAAECGDLASHRWDSRASHGEGRSIQGGNMLHGECGPSWRASAAPAYGAVGVYRGGSFHINFMRFICLSQIFNKVGHK